MTQTITEQPLISFGPFSLSTINFGFFRLDGGAMFGSVPKNIWSRKIAPDEQNRILLAQRSLVIRTHDKVFLVDIGMGEKWNDKSRGIYAIENFAYTPVLSEVTDLILTHLHFDHAGGISFWNDAGVPVPTLPGRTIHIQQANYEHAKAPNRKERASYLPENVDIVAQHPLHLLSRTEDIASGISGHRVDGHTIGQQWIEVTHDQMTVLFATDLIPTRHHIHPAFQMGYDICALTVMREKEEFLDYAYKRGAIVVFQHDPEVAAARVIMDEKGEYGWSDL